MIAKLIYNLEKTEDKQALSLALKSHDLFFTLWDFDQILRSYLKHSHKFKTADDAIEVARSNLLDIMADKGIDFDMVD